MSSSFGPEQQRCKEIEELSMAIVLVSWKAGSEHRTAEPEKQLPLVAHSPVLSFTEVFFFFLQYYSPVHCVQAL
jgi:hypothetical protein